MKNKSSRLYMADPVPGGNGPAAASNPPVVVDFAADVEKIIKPLIEKWKTNTAQTGQSKIAIGYLSSAAEFAANHLKIVADSAQAEATKK